MSSPPRAIALKCVNCGSKLEITVEMDRFACGYCGTEQLVERKGGTVALKGVEEAISRVQAGTDRTAAELAITRLEKELQETSRARMAQEHLLTSGGGRAFVIGFVVFFVIAALAINIIEQVAPPADGIKNDTASGAGALIGAVAGVLVGAAVRRAQVRNNEIVYGAKLSELQSQEADLRERIARTKGIANS